MATTDDPAYVEHPLLAPETIERRLYQLQLAGRAMDDHTLVCLPTGLGKTTVSLLVTARRLDEVGGTSLLLAPTKPLVRQHAEFYREALTLPDDDIVVFTGDVRPDDRASLWSDAQVVVATPQVIENDLIGGRISLADVTHCTFDECHRATGEYPYTYIADQYHQTATDPLVTGMSASPGESEEAVRTVCQNLGIRSVEVMTDDDADIDQYTYTTDVEWDWVELPESLAEIRDLIDTVIEQRLGRLQELGITTKSDPDLSQQDLNKLRGKIQELINSDNPAGYEGMSIHAEIMKLRRAKELVETQSVTALERYFDRQQQAARSSGASKATQRMVSDTHIKQAIEQTANYDGHHPKFERARARIVEALGIEDGNRVIVFTESRDTAELLAEEFQDNFDTHRFVGQNDREGSEGMTQQEQQSVLESFRNGEFEVLVSTSVAEEGLDVPEVDLVLFYEPVPTAIRTIQRKGRTGRQTAGKVVGLVTEDTRDEVFFWMARRRQDTMLEELETLKSMTDDISDDLSQAGLDEFTDTAESPEEDHDKELVPEPDDVTAEPTDDAAGTVAAPSTAETVEVVVDQRELDSTVARELSLEADIETRLETLAVGDYVCSDRVAVERKTVEDFLDTLLGEQRSIFEQVGDLTRHYDRPLLMIEGEGLYERRDIHPNALHGALSSLAVDYGVSILRARDADETVDLLATIARREQTDRDRTVSAHGKKQDKTLPEQQEYVVSSIAEVGPVTAQALLSAFGSVQAVMTASKEELMTVSGVGEVTAERIREVVTTPYEE